MNNLTSLLIRIKNGFINWIANIRIYPGGLIVFGDSHYEIKGPHMRTILDLIEPGDILLRRFDHYLGSVCIPGYWSHSALYVGNNNVIHMLGDGITKEDVLTFMRCDDIAILRCSDTRLITVSIERAHKYLSMEIEYDYDFESIDKKEMYCTEFVARCYEDKSLIHLFNKKVIYPDDLLESIFNIIWSRGNA